eukprot:1158079-Pelagomonas_calceolata.AAC.5
MSFGEAQDGSQLCVCVLARHSFVMLGLGTPAASEPESDGQQQQKAAGPVCVHSPAAASCLWLLDLYLHPLCRPFLQSQMGSSNEELQARCASIAIQLQEMTKKAEAAKAGQAAAKLELAAARQGQAVAKQELHACRQELVDAHGQLTAAQQGQAAAKQELHACMQELADAHGHVGVGDACVLLLLSWLLPGRGRQLSSRSCMPAGRSWLMLMARIGHANWLVGFKLSASMDGKVKELTSRVEHLRAEREKLLKLIAGEQAASSSAKASLESLAARVGDVDVPVCGHAKHNTLMQDLLEVCVVWGSQAQSSLAVCTTAGICIYPCSLAVECELGRKALTSRTWPPVPRAIWTWLH